MTCKTLSRAITRAASVSRRAGSLVPMIALALVLLAGAAQAGPTPVRNLTGLSVGTDVVVLRNGTRTSGTVAIRGGRKVVVVPQRRQFERRYFLGSPRSLGGIRSRVVLRR